MPESLFNENIGSEIFTNIKVNDIVNFIYADTPYENFKNFYHFFLSQSEENSDFNFENYTWAPQFPDFF